MNQKFDLSRVPYEDIHAELARRFPAGTLSFFHPIDGKPGQMGMRSERWGADALVTTAALYSYELAKARLIQTAQTIPGGQALDPGAQPPPIQPPTM